MSAFATLLIAVAAGAAADPAHSPQPAQTERAIERELPAASREVHVQHTLGACTIRVVGANDHPRARLELVASGLDPDAEKSFLDLANLDVKGDARGTTAALVTTVRSLLPPADRKPEQLSFAANLFLWLPAGTALTLESSFGKVVIDGALGAIDVKHRFGTVDVTGPRGSLRVGCEYGAITVTNVTGDAILTNKSAAITAERVSGRVEAHTSGDRIRIDGAASVFAESRLKTIEVRHVAGDARIVAPFCEVVTADAIGGALAIESNNSTITVDGVGGTLTIQQTNGKIDVRNVRGDATLRGNLSTIVATDITGAVEARSASAPIKLVRVGGKLVAENSAFALEIVDPGGDVDATASGGLLKARWSRLPANGAPRELALEAAGGNIEFELPADGSAELELSSTIGQLDCALPGMSFTQSGATRVGKLKLGSGKHKLHAISVGGAIRVRRVVNQ